MRVGIFHQMWALSETSDRQVIEDARQDVLLADELGYESFWFGEHHANREKAFYGRVPIPELVIARFAAETRQIRLGTGVKVLPFDTASRFAEAMALLDILTDGRAHYAVGMAVRTNPDAVDHDRGPLFREQLSELVRHLDGDYGDDLKPMTPAPERDLKGLLWIAAREPASVAHAAKLGLNFVVGQAEQGIQQRTYVDMYRNSGGTGEARGARMVYVGETDADAWSVVGESATRSFRNRRNSAYGRLAVAEGRMSEEEIEDPAEILRQIEYVAGSPETVAAGLKRYIETAGVDRVDLLMHMPGVPHDGLQRSMRLFADAVAPLMGIDMGEPARV